MHAGDPLSLTTNTVIAKYTWSAFEGAGTAKAVEAPLSDPIDPLNRAVVASELVDDAMARVRITADNL